MTATAAPVRERPILFSGPMIRAILDKTKTQTRRVVKVKPDGAHGPCPYGGVGDRLWVRETWSCPRQIGGSYVREKRMYKADETSPYLDYSNVVWKPSIHMPRQFSRITLEITGMRVERLQAITANDCIAEGIPSRGIDRDGPCIASALMYIDDYQKLWDSLNASRGYGWEPNPYVWVISFRKVA
jgi:hypothetical protein